MKPIVLATRIVPRPSARRELVQALVSWAESVRQEPGVVTASIYEDLENPGALRAEAEWEDAPAMENHLRSGTFGVLLGALELLACAPQLSVTTSAIGYESDPMGTIRKVRGSWRAATHSTAHADDKGGH